MGASPVYGAQAKATNGRCFGGAEGATDDKEGATKSSRRSSARAEAIPPTREGPASCATGTCSLRVTFIGNAAAAGTRAHFRTGSKRCQAPRHRWWRTPRSLRSARPSSATAGCPPSQRCCKAITPSANIIHHAAATGAPATCTDSATPTGTKEALSIRRPTPIELTDWRGATHPLPPMNHSYLKWNSNSNRSRSRPSCLSTS